MMLTLRFQNKTLLLIVSLALPIFYFIPGLLNAINYLYHDRIIYFDLSKRILMVLSSFYLVSVLVLATFVYYDKCRNRLSQTVCIKLVNLLGSATLLLFSMQMILLLLIANAMCKRQGLSLTHTFELLKKGLFYHRFDLSLLFLTAILFALFKKKLKQELFVNEKQTSGHFGSAAWAGMKEIQSGGLFNAKKGILSGRYQDQYLYLPLLNKLTISPLGGGKTTSSSIPALLSHDGPVFVFDVKGELWATTARYRSETLKRQIIVIDPYKVTKGKDFAEGKPPELLKEYMFNPFDWIPENREQRDRMINAFASSFVIEEGGTTAHFDDNAKILIRGYIDYMMQSLPKASRNLQTLYQLLSEHQEQAQFTFEQMSQLSGRSAAAANQISRVGSDERGSILSTSYRQIDWMSDSNIQHTLSTSNFDLSDFLKGNMDIFIVLPEDQIKEHARLVRMLFSLIKTLIIQANPSELPQQKMLFLLEELAQLGYCPDVEQAIEILRARKVVVWTVFQTLNQIELYKKPDLFKGATIKQIFTNDDTKTMEWIQQLGGKSTVMTKTLSTNSGDSKQKMQIIGGSVSTGEGESVHETGIDLIPINEIREMPSNIQMIFMHGMKPIFCEKTRYFESECFKGRYDSNPLEN